MAPEQLPDFLAGEVLPYMASLGRDAPDIARLFADARWQIRDPEATQLLVAGAAALVPHSFAGEVLDSIIVSASPRMLDASFQTGPELARIMIGMAMLRPEEQILDLACGSGGLLAAAVRAFPSSNTTSLVGVELDPRLARLALARLMLVQVTDPLPEGSIGPQIEPAAVVIRPADARETSAIALTGLAGALREFSLTLCDPPLGTTSSKHQSTEIRPDLIQTDRLDLSLAEVSVKALTPGGRAVVVVLDSLLRDVSGEASAFRKFILGNKLRAVVELDPRVRGAHVSPFLLLIERNDQNETMTATTEKPVWYYSHRRSQDVEDLLSRWSAWARSDTAPDEEAAKDGICWLLSRDQIERAGGVLHPERFGEVARLPSHHGTLTVPRPVHQGEVQHGPSVMATSAAQSDLLATEVAAALRMTADALDTLRKAVKFCTLPPSTQRLPLTQLVHRVPSKRPEAVEEHAMVPCLPLQSVSLSTGEITGYEMRPALEVMFQGWLPFREGDLLVSRLWSVPTKGKVTVARGMPGTVGFASGEFLILRCFPQSPLSVLPEYLACVLRSEAFRQEAGMVLNGTTQGRLRLPAEFILNYLIPVPSLETQHQVIATLVSANCLVHLLNETLPPMETLRDTLSRWTLAAQNKQDYDKAM